jgi:hypothetical protein
MKKVLIAALLIVGLSSFAQERRERPNRAEMENLTPEQRNQLIVKKMTNNKDKLVKLLQNKAQKGKQ